MAIKTERERERESFCQWRLPCVVNGLDSFFFFVAPKIATVTSVKKLKNCAVTISY